MHPSIHYLASFDSNFSYIHTLVVYIIPVNNFSYLSHALYMGVGERRWWGEDGMRRDGIGCMEGSICTYIYATYARLKIRPEPLENYA